MELLDGKKLSQEILSELKEKLADAKGPPPCVTFIRVGEDPASVYYVNSKQKKAALVGIESRLKTFPESITQEQLLEEIGSLNADSSVHGILVQAPLPSHMDERTVFNSVAPEKDVDGFSTNNLGRLVQEDPEAFVACTPAGIAEMIRRYKIKTEGRHVVVLGRSLIVGKPAALLFMRKDPFANATVTVCHSRTRNLSNITRQADILIAAIGQANFVTADMVSPGTIVVDVGINRVDDPSSKKGYRIVGDVDFDAVAPKCDAISPVPGGVGLMTVAMLMHNTMKAWELSQKKNH
ncbi:bifunctional methylenetetrahydrofolate dehydrogenase/methenyltetrahydrofolate cyclohydrolase FolD [Puniceicoccales bacterium CK1056]|uniref:Bifunctional protein FolD n=1 Tax=Oceanipulchritudo coccoides TaxID=2706888 RepID=A0A6B2M1J3_9BACT|nr:bifunctional methylenetetrahydrofolate dehydrogenase/methenyltetrahydrofolate cyclohydrolase FolD [Oceanipulchritudo coccoides]NDV62004.1 bifunctional methylenetetrahydrofolate dehydrogenase/methenyltetrahydrofolate cyclohydrolase FolD [Oceanipulchritudo coccoides]